MVKRHKNPRLCASIQGKAMIKAARTEKKWGWDTNINEKPLELASMVIDSDWQLSAQYIIGYDQPTWAKGINEVSWTRFLSGKLVPAKVFWAYCQILELNWDEVVDLERINGEYLFPCAPVADRPIVGDVTKFVKDVTIPDGANMTAGEKFTKIWRIRNAGTVLWKDRFLLRIGKSKSVSLICSEPRVPIPNTLPGELVDISVELQAPYIATTTEAIWKMSDSQNRLYFPDRHNGGLKVCIVVAEPE